MRITAGQNVQSGLEEPRTIVWQDSPGFEAESSTKTSNHPLVLIHIFLPTNQSPSSSQSSFCFIPAICTNVLPLSPYVAGSCWYSLFTSQLPYIIPNLRCPSTIQKIPSNVPSHVINRPHSRNISHNQNVDFAVYRSSYELRKSNHPRNIKRTEIQNRDRSRPWSWGDGDFGRTENKWLITLHFPTQDISLCLFHHHIISPHALHSLVSTIHSFPSKSVPRAPHPHLTTIASFLEKESYLSSVDAMIGIDQQMQLMLF